MVARIWHGWTSPENAEAYGQLLETFVIPSIESMTLKGYHKICVMRRDLDKEVEFTTIMKFEDLAAVKKFAGEEYTKAYVPNKVKPLLLRFDETAAHYEIIDEIEYD